MHRQETFLKSVAGGVSGPFNMHSSGEVSYFLLIPKIVPSHADQLDRLPRLARHLPIPSSGLLSRTVSSIRIDVDPFRRRSHHGIPGQLKDDSRSRACQP